VGGKYSDEWHRIHLINPRDLVPESNMPAYPWLEKTPGGPGLAAPRMKALRTVGVPYTDAEIAKAAEEVKGKTEMDATIAYLQVLGTAPQVKEPRHGRQHLRSITTAGRFVTFHGHRGWAWSAAQQGADFEEAAQLPFEQEGTS
jgi:hypothetical protein